MRSRFPLAGALLAAALGAAADPPPVKTVPAPPSRADWSSWCPARSTRRPTPRNARRCRGSLPPARRWTCSLLRDWLPENTRPGAKWDATGVGDPDDGHALLVPGKNADGTYTVETWGFKPPVSGTPAGLRAADSEFVSCSSLDRFQRPRARTEPPALHRPGSAVGVGRRQPPPAAPVPAARPADSRSGPDPAAGGVDQSQAG